MTTGVFTGILLIVLPVAYNGLYTLLARSFDYPDILRRPTAEVLERFSAGGSALILTWWAFAMSAVLLAPTAVLVSATFTDANPTLLTVAAAIGLLAALVQFLGLIRWPFAVPHLAREMANPTSSASKRDAIDVVFQTLNRYLGVAVGEHFGYLFTGLWTGLVGVAVIQSDVLHPAFGVVGLVLAPLFLLGSMEFVGANERDGFEIRWGIGSDRLHWMVAVASGLGHRAAGYRMTWRPRQLGQQSGRTFVITGANSGIGFETARELVGRGAHVVLAVRDITKGEGAAARLTGPGSTSVVELDLADLDQVAGCAKRLLDGHDDLSALICNAGIMGGPRLISPQGFELQMATNHLGHVALICGLWPVLELSTARVVLLSSNEAKRGQLSAQTTRDQLLNPEPYDGKQVYRNTKQANLLFAQELHRRCEKGGSPVRAVAVHPGAVSTNLFAHQLDRAGRSVLGSVSKIVTKVLLPSPAAGARGALRAVDESTPSGAFVAPAGFAQLRGLPELAEVYPSAKDPAIAARLWELTEEVLGNIPGREGVLMPGA